MADDPLAIGATVAGRWLSEIDRSQQSSEMRTWNTSCDVIRKIYRYDQSDSRKTRRYSMLWSNIETLAPAVYSQTPKAVVQRRWSDPDKVGRVACDVLERGINFQFELNDFNSSFEQVMDDFLLYARGVARVYYEPVTVTVEDEDDLGAGLDLSAVKGPEVEANEENSEAQAAGDPEEVLDFEHVKIRFVHREDFAHSISRTWDEVTWVAFRAFLDRDDLIKRFGEEVGSAVPIESSPEMPEGSKSSGGDDDKAIIWEVWDKSSQKVLWIAKGYGTVLEESAPYLKLTGFFPCPKPAFGTLTNDTLAPVPDYIFYQDQCEEIDNLTKRISSLTESLKLVGFYPGGPDGEGSPEVEKAVRPGFENKMVAVKSWDAFKGAGGSGGAPIIWLPVEMVATIIKECVALRQQIIQDVYQIFGLSDIMRGDGNASETATAQNIKAQYGSVRIRNRQKVLAEFCRDISRLTGEIIATQFQPETLAKMSNLQIPTRAEVQQQFEQETTQYQQAVVAFQGQQQAAQFAAAQAQQAGQQVPPAPQQQPPQPPQPPDVVTWDDVTELFHDGVLRRFRLDIEADSTIVGDESQERTDRMAFIDAVTKFVETWAPIVQGNPAMLPMARAMLMFGVRAFRVGRELEETIEEVFDRLEQLAGQPPAPPQPSPDEQIKLEGTKVKTQAEIQKAQIGAQAAQVDGQTKIASTILDHHAKLAEHQMGQQKMAAQMQAEREKTALGVMSQAAQPAPQNPTLDGWRNQ